MTHEYKLTVTDLGKLITLQALQMGLWKTESNNRNYSIAKLIKALGDNPNSYHVSLIHKGFTFPCNLRLIQIIQSRLAVIDYVTPSINIPAFIKVLETEELNTITSGDILSELQDLIHIRSVEKVGIPHDQIRNNIHSVLYDPDDTVEIIGDYDELSLAEIQKSVGEWAQRNFGNNQSKHPIDNNIGPMGSLCPLLGIIEEVGELAHCVLKAHQGIRGFNDSEKYLTERDDALGDILIYLCDFATREGVNLQETLNKVFHRVVLKRNWVENPHNG